MRRSAPNFKVEVRRPRRAPRFDALDQASDDTGDVFPDDVPSRDVNDDPDLGSIWGGDQHRTKDHAPARSAEATNTSDEISRVFANFGEREDLSKLEPLASSETRDTGEDNEIDEALTPVAPRVLRSLVTQPDPVQQRLAETPPERQPRPRKPRAQNVDEPWPDEVQIAGRQMAEPPAVPTPALATVAAATTALSTAPRTSSRAAGRLLYNRWTYETCKREAVHHDRSEALNVLRPHERWKRRLPVQAW